MNQTDAALGDMLPSTLFLSDDDVGALAHWPAAVSALASAYAKPMHDAMVPPRSMARGDGIWLRGLTAVSPSGGYMGCKLIAASMKARRASYLIALFDQQTMALAALMDGNRITGIRTAATAALAVDLLAPSRPLSVAVIGSGFEARNLLYALMATRTVSTATVFSPTPASRERFAASFRGECGLAISAADSAPTALCGTDVVLCAARSRDESPVLLGAWLEPGMTVVSVGSTLPEQREADEQALARARRVVADMKDEVAYETGDAIAATSAGIDLGAKLVSLADVVSGRALGRNNPEDILIYKSVGSALQDVVISEMLFERARRMGMGTPLPVSIRPNAK